MNTLIRYSLLAGVACIVGWTTVASFGYNNAMVPAQNSMSAQYDNNRQFLASFARRIETMVGVKNNDYKQLAKVFATVGSRYHGDANGSASTADATKTGTMFSAIKEAYPQVDQSTAAKILKVVEVQEDQFVNLQTGFRDTVRQWDDHTQTMWFALLNKFPWNNFPNDHLAAIGPKGTKLYGKAALDQMRSLVTSAESDRSFGTNQFDGPKLPD